MNLQELSEQAENIRREILFEAHHDAVLFHTHEDVEALNRMILLIKFLEEKNPSDEVKISEILKAVQIDF